MRLISMLLSLAVIALSHSANAQTSVTAIALFKDRAMLSVDGQKAKIVNAGSQHKGVKLLSSNTSEAVIEVNGQRETLTLNGTATITDQLGSFDPTVDAVVEMKVNEAGFFESVGTVNGRRINFLVDTGASLVVMNSIQADSIGLNFKEGERSLAATASGSALMYTVNLDRISLGGISLRDVKAGVIEGAFPEVPLLGMTFLNKVNMTRDGELMTLTER